MNWKKNIYIYIYKIEDDVSMKEKENSESINRLVEIKRSAFGELDKSIIRACMLAFLFSIIIYIKFILCI